MRVGIRELQTQISKVLQEVTDRGNAVEITRRGRVIAKIVPAKEGLTAEEVAKTKRILVEIDRLAEEIAAKWPDGVSAVEAVRDQRR